ncbi:MAG TPA: TonB-dependent receptor [Bryobacteraceae bacterium]|nr:TonB-dependent receptor [Bryobacteraceae bacterium]
MTRETVRNFLFLFVLLMCVGITVDAQVAGRLSGSVVDPSGMAVPGATVNVYVRGGKEPVLSGKTNEAGLFAFTAVRPGAYDLAVESTGFGKVVMRDISVAPVQETGLAPIKLEIQSATQVVEVAADVQSVQLSNAEVSSTVTATQVQNLPVLGRQISVLLQTQPGVSSGSGTTVVNGLRASFSNVTLDGINIQDNFLRGNSLDYAPMRTTIDQVAEITITSSNASAAIGGGASQMVLSTKSGSNDFHGAAYWYNRNSALAANDWFNNKDGVERTPINLNQVGAALGGHIIRDKLFFYTNYELFRDKKKSSRLRTVLTDSARKGIFTYRDTGGNLQTANLQALRGFQLDPTTKAMIASLPQPNSTDAGDGLNTSGYRFNARYNEFRDQFVYKSDYYLSAKHNLTGTYNYIDDPTDRPDQGTFYTDIPPVSNTIKNHMLALSWRWTASPTLTNEVRGGFMRSDTAFLVSNEYPKFLLSATNLLFSNPVNTFLNQGRKVNTYSLQDNANWIKGRHEVSFGFQGHFLRTAPFNDAGILPTYTLGISSANTSGLTAADLPGIRSSDQTMANNLFANLAGIVSSAAQTFNVTSTTSGFVPGATNLRNLKYDTYSGYVQDKWKVRSDLTLSFGMRYEYWTPLDEKNSLYLTPRLVNNDVRATLLDPNAVLDFAGSSAGRPFYKADKNNFAPNVGFAWAPFKQSKTSIRGGYMIAYVNDNVVAAVRNNVTTANGLQFANTLSNRTEFLASAPVVPAPAYKVPRTLADNYAITTQSAAGAPNPNLSTPYVHQWSFGVEHDYKGAVLSVRYLGNRARSLLRAFDYNQVLYNANGFLADFKRAQGNAALSEASGKGYIGAYNAAIPGSQQLTVFPQLTGAGNFTSSKIQTFLRQGQVGELANEYMVNRQATMFYTNPALQGANTVDNAGWSNYHAAEFQVVKRTRSGLQAQFSYTFGKVLSNTSGDLGTGFEPLLDNNNPNLERARAPFDMTHAFKANYYYELPYGHGKRWSGNRLMNTVLGGWSIAGVWSYQSGSPYSILSGLGTLNRAGRSTSSNTASVAGTTLSTLEPLTSGVWRTGDGEVYFLSPTIIGADGRGTNNFGSQPFEGQVFYNPEAGTVGNLQRRAFNGPWQWSWNISTMKSVRFGERHSVDLRADMFNWMNHPTFYVPPTSGDYGSQAEFTINNTSFGKVSGMNYDSRVLQFGLYYRF